MSKVRPSLPIPSPAQLAELVASLQLPPPSSITPLSESTGVYHSIYVICFPEDAEVPVPASEGKKRLILRVSGAELPHTKTINEVATMNWVCQNTSIPTPAIMSWDSSSANPLKREYTLLEFIPGVLLSDIIDKVEDKKSLVNQLIDFLLQLYSQSWNHVGGLKFDGNQEIPGPLVNWDFWQAWEDYWPDPQALNLCGPYENYSSFSLAQLEKHRKEIDTHSSLEDMRDLPFDELELIIRAASGLNDTRYVLAHKDMHLGNIMYDLESGRVTSVLDWELAAVVPYQLWNPGNFLWRGKTTSEDDDGRGIQSELLGLFEQICEERGLPLVKDAQFSSDACNKIQKAVDTLCYIVNSRVRGWQRERTLEYRQDFEKLIQNLKSEMV
jgi:hypothetical protein